MSTDGSNSSIRSFTSSCTSSCYCNCDTEDFSSRDAVSIHSNDSECFTETICTQYTLERECLFNLFEAFMGGRVIEDLNSDFPLLQDATEQSKQIQKITNKAINTLNPENAVDRDLVYPACFNEHPLQEQKDSDDRMTSILSELYKYSVRSKSYFYNAFENEVKRLNEKNEKALHPNYQRSKTLFHLFFPKT